ncbi:hypothetical protein ACQ4PT_019265 [Festuca glaucescens]
MGENLTRRPGRVFDDARRAGLATVLITCRCNHSLICHCRPPRANKETPSGSAQPADAPSGCRRKPRDPFGELPAELLPTILSHLDVKQAARTSVLASAWRHTWKHSPKLTLDIVAMCGDGGYRHNYLKPGGEELYRRRYVQRFIDTVDEVLRQRHGGGGAVEHLELRFDECHFRQVSSRLYGWIRFAVSSRAKSVRLHVSETSGVVYGRDRYKLPLLLLDAGGGLSKLDHINLSFVSLKVPFHAKSTGFPDLSSLVLRLATVSTSDLQHMLSNCPNLERLDMDRVYLDDQLTVHRPLPRLLYLRMVDCRTSTIELNANNLTTFVFRGSSAPTIINLGGTSGLRNVNIQCYKLTLQQSVTSLPNAFPERLLKSDNIDGEQSYWLSPTDLGRCTPRRSSHRADHLPLQPQPDLPLQITALQRRNHTGSRTRRCTQRRPAEADPQQNNQKSPDRKPSRGAAAHDPVEAGREAGREDQRPVERVGDWEHAWKHSPSLTLDIFAICGAGYRLMLYHERYVQRFLDMADAILRQRRGSVVEQLEIRVDAAAVQLVSRRLDDWVRFAAEARAKSLTLHVSSVLPSWMRPSDLYALPLQLLDDGGVSSLQHIHLSCVLLKLPSPSLPKLKRLGLCYAHVSAADFGDMLSNCPNLEWLDLYYVHLNDELKVDRPFSRLRYLRLADCSVTQIKLTATDLATFIFQGRSLPSIDLGETPRLCDVNVYCHEITMEHALSSLSDAFPMVQRLSFHSITIELEFPWRLENASRFPHLRHL